MALATVPTTLGLVWVIAHHMNMAIYVQQLVSLIGIAISIDYSLLIVYRYREELDCQSGDSARRSSDDGHRRPRRAVLGSQVAIGLALLVLLPLPFIRSMGIGGVLIPLVSIAAAMTLLPAVLAIMGTSVNRLRVVPRSVIEAPKLRRRGCGHGWPQSSCSRRRDRRDRLGRADRLGDSGGVPVAHPGLQQGTARAVGGRAGAEGAGTHARPGHDVAGDRGDRLAAARRIAALVPRRSSG